MSMPVSVRSVALQLFALSFLLISRAPAQAIFVPPASPRQRLNFNPGWKFIRQDVTGGQNIALDDSQWETISTPHSFNETDSFRTIISHSGGDRGTYKGLAWYRKHFKLPAEVSGDKIFIEFEGMRQAGDISSMERNRPLRKRHHRLRHRYHRCGPIRPG
jgi:beta-galactosidase